MQNESIGEMNGHIREVGASFAVVVDGKIVALRPDRESAEECLMKIYLFRTESVNENR
jgi:hypothetical protein